MMYVLIYTYMEYKIGLELKFQGKNGCIKFTDEDGILFESGDIQEFIPYSQLEGLEPVSTGEIVKLQKPNENSFDDVHQDQDGNSVGNCTECGQTDVTIKDHVCQTLMNITQDELEDNDYVPSFEKFCEAKITEYISFEDTQIARLKKLWSFQHVKYHNNPFFNSIMKTLEDKKRLTKKQFEELDYLLTNGKTRYEAGILSTKN